MSEARFHGSSFLLFVDLFNTWVKLHDEHQSYVTEVCLSSLDSNDLMTISAGTEALCPHAQPILGPQDG